MTSTENDLLIARHRAANNYDACRREYKFRQEQLGEARAAIETADCLLEEAVESVGAVMIEQGLREMDVASYTFRLDADNRLTVESFKGPTP